MPQRASRFLFIPITAVLLAFLPSSGMEAQAPAQQLEDVIYLKDGSIIRGIIVEQRPGENVLIRTRDGNQLRYRLDQIDRLAKEAAPRPVAVVAPKNGVAAVALSLLLPGAGQGYNSQWGKATGFFLTAMVSWGAMASAVNTDECARNEECGSASGWAILYLGNYIWSAVDAGVSAGKINARTRQQASLFVRPSAHPAMARLPRGVHSEARLPRISALQVGVRVRW